MYLLNVYLPERKGKENASFYNQGIYSNWHMVYEILNVYIEGLCTLTPWEKS